jgi:DNA mismatch endonuclease (patch repair protein)
MTACSAGRDTKPEMAVRRLLHEAGVRYRVGSPIKLPGRRAVKPDLVWKIRKLAVFIDGCFWHVCPEHHNPPKTNLDYWVPKLARNVARDREQTAALEALGWRVLRFWEHDDPAYVAAIVEAYARDRVFESSEGHVYPMTRDQLTACVSSLTEAIDKNASTR